VRGRSAGVRFSYGGMVAFKLAEARPELVLRNVFWASLTAGRLIIRRKPT
jgi:pimeloyl-ACP methyl ester carboxylesterase